MSLSCICNLSVGCFYYVCGLFITFRQTKYEIKIKANFSNAYETYLDKKIGEQDIICAPHVICRTC